MSHNNRRMQEKSDCTYPNLFNMSCTLEMLNKGEIIKAETSLNNIESFICIVETD